jgi:hypothetical protein
MPPRMAGRMPAAVRGRQRPEPAQQDCHTYGPDHTAAPKERDTNTGSGTDAAKGPRAERDAARRPLKPTRPEHGCEGPQTTRQGCRNPRAPPPPDTMARTRWTAGRGGGAATEGRTSLSRRPWMAALPAYGCWDAGPGPSEPRPVVANWMAHTA